MLGERADFEFRCFNNVNHFRKPENTLPPHSGRTRRLRITENTHITSNTHPRPFSQCSPHRLFGGGGTSRSRSGACRGWITVFARMYALLRPSALPAPGLPSHISSVSEAGRATLFVCRVGHAVPSAFVSDAVSLCSVCCLTSSPASPRRLDRSAAPGGSVRVPPRLPRRRTPSLPARGRFPRTCVPAPRIGFGRCALLLPLFRIGCEYVPPPPRAPFSLNTYPAWGAEHPRTGARRAP